MSALRTPSVLIIDDHPDEERVFAAVLESRDLKVIIRRPNEVDDDDLRFADVILIDQFYDWTSVPHPAEPLYWPIDGLAVAAIVSSHLPRLDHRASIILRTGDLAKLARGLPLAARVPLVAQQRGVDWILEKSQSNDHAIETLCQLAHAATSLDPLAESDPDWNEGELWLSLPRAAWSERALAEVQVCRPPEHAMATYTAGTAWLRWFAHRVLPYPSFLVSDLRAATSMRLTLAAFERVVEDPSSKVGAQVRACVYSGELAGLAGRRWWRSGIDSLVDAVLVEFAESPSEIEALNSGYGHLDSRTFDLVEYNLPVITLDSDYHESGVADASQCVRLAPDLWPMFADEPWAKIDDVLDDELLAAMVSRGDRHLISGEAQAQ